MKYELVFENDKMALFAILNDDFSSNDRISVNKIFRDGTVVPRMCLMPNCHSISFAAKIKDDNMPDEKFTVGFRENIQFNGYTINSIISHVHDHVIPKIKKNNYWKDSIDFINQG